VVSKSGGLEMVWQLHEVKDDVTTLVRDDCTCADQCKNIARKRRIVPRASLFEPGHYDQEVIYIIYDPFGRKYQESLKNTGWRMKWKFVGVYDEKAED
jgi:hypothetical protein